MAQKLYTDAAKTRLCAKFEHKLGNLSSAKKKLPSMARDQRDVRSAPCAVCFEPLGKCSFSESATSGGAQLLMCRHVFHIAYIQQWLAPKSLCPICRLRDPKVAPSPPLQTRAGGPGSFRQKRSGAMQVPRAKDRDGRVARARSHKPAFNI